MEKQFKIPVCIFLFKRSVTLRRIFDVLRVVKPSKIYLRSDEGRTDEEKEAVAKVRKLALELIDWNCEVVRDFASTNRGVYENIGLGAYKIFDTEEKCIFIEDDNLPNESFFYYCERMLEHFKNDEKALLVCGTNYGGDKFKNYKSDYFRVKALLPCGWASWSHKFKKYYPLLLEEVDEPSFKKTFIKKYNNKPLARQQYKSVLFERTRFNQGLKFNSWDFHLIETIMVNDLFVISPKVNLIRNIGVDVLSTHNQINFKKYKKDVMTKRFCEVPTFELNYGSTLMFNEKENQKYQKFCDHMICRPLSLRIKSFLVLCRNFVFRKTK